MNRLDNIGKKVGSWTIINYNQPKRAYYCACDCGRYGNVKHYNLFGGRSYSCGCGRKGRPDHMMSHTRPHNIWSKMIERCTNKNCVAWKDYGGRGIIVCESWRNFNNFWNDMKNKYDDHVQEYGERNTTLDRINVDGNYETGNCKWSTYTEQVHNRRPFKRPNCRRLITFNGKTMGLYEWAEYLNMNYRTLSSRINLYQWSVEKSFLTPVR